MTRFATPEDCVAYVVDLRRTPKGSPTYVIGEQVWRILDGGTEDELVDCLYEWMFIHHAGTREHEVAREIWLLSGRTGVAA